MSDEERVNANENGEFLKKGGREGRSGGPRLHAKVSLAFSCDGLTRLEATALHTGDPGKVERADKQDNNSSVFHQDGRLRGRAMLTMRVFLDGINPIQ